MSKHEIKNDHSYDMSTLVNRLTIKAGVMEMGERIKWASDTELMREAAASIESMTNQIQLMYKYIEHLEDAEKELMCMLNKYHADDCVVCDQAYKAQDIAQFQRGVFHGCAASAMEKDNWVVQDS